MGVPLQGEIEKQTKQQTSGRVVQVYSTAMRCDVKYCGNCAKCTIIVFNVIIFLGGAAIVAFGIVGLASPSTINDMLTVLPGLQYINYFLNIDQAILNNCILMTVIGAVIMVLTVVGIVGACFENKPVLVFYVALVVLLVVLELSLMLWASIDRQAIEIIISNMMFEALQTFFQPIQTVNGDDVFTDPTLSKPASAWQSLQFAFSCCGARNYTDYQLFKWNNTVIINGSVVIYNAVVPPACCLQTTLYYLPNPDAYFVDLIACLTGPASSRYARDTLGCYTVAVNQLSDYTYISIIISASLITIEILMIILSLSAMNADFHLKRSARKASASTC